MLRTAVAALATICLLAPTARAVEPLMRAQGSVMTSGGTPASGTFDMTFRLYAAETGGSVVYTEAEGAVTVAGGVFDVTLGPFGAGFFDANPTLWLETVVDGTALPRQPLRAVPYALTAARATVAASAEGLTCTGCVGSGQLSVPYAAAATKGGDALGLDCDGCVDAGALAPGAVAATHLQDGSVTAARPASPMPRATRRSGLWISRVRAAWGAPTFRPASRSPATPPSAGPLPHARPARPDARCRPATRACWTPATGGSRSRWRRGSA